MAVYFGGQNRKLSPELIARIAQYVREGNYQTVACQACGIAVSTWQNWRDVALSLRDEGREPKSEYEGLCLQFWEAIEQAEADHEARLVEKVETYADRKEDWRGIAHKLERRHPDRWGKSEPRPQESKDDTPGLLKSMFKKMKESFRGKEPK